MHPSQAEWATFYEAFKRKTGLDLYLYKPQQLQRRIMNMVDSKHCKSLDEFWKKLNADPKGVEWLQDRLAINVSELFRNPEKFAELEKKVIPDLLKNSSKLKIWSAGCSYGAEAHSLACILAANFPGPHTVLGTDIDQEVLAKAKVGLFNDADMRCVPEAYRKSFFTKQTEGWQAEQSIRKYLTFKTGNLLGDRFETGFDLILCRNVVIYFTDEAKDDLYRKFFAALKPGGILFVGGTERIFRADDMGFSTKLPYFYQKPTEERLWRNAS